MLKLSGQCGRLKCCLNYELELYNEALQNFPSEDIKLRTEAGEASLRKTDILKKMLWYSYENSYNWIPVSLDRVNEIIDKNKAGVIPPALSDNPLASDLMNKTLEYKDELLQDTDLTRLDHKKSSKGKRKPFRNRKRNNPSDQKNTSSQKPKADQNSRDQKNRPQNRNRKRGRGGKPKDGKD
jgi:hypothetical protein